MKNNNYFAIMLLCAIVAQPIYPMAGTNPESRSWISSLKKSVISDAVKHYRIAVYKKQKMLLN